MTMQAPVIFLDQVRKERRARRMRPFARRVLFSFAIGTSLVGGVVLLGVAATALTPHNMFSLAGALLLGTAFGWPLSSMLMERLHRAHEAKAARRGAPRHPARGRHASQHPATRHPASRQTASAGSPRSRSRLVPNPIHPSSLQPDPPSRRRS